MKAEICERLRSSSAAGAMAKSSRCASSRDISADVERCENRRTPSIHSFEGRLDGSKPRLANVPQACCDHPHGVGENPSGFMFHGLTSMPNVSSICLYHRALTPRAMKLSPRLPYHMGSVAPELRSCVTMGGGV